METNTLTNSTPIQHHLLDRTWPRLLLSLFCTALAYAIAIVLVSLTLRPQKPDILPRVFALWSITTGHTCLVIVYGFCTTNQQTVRTLRDVPRQLVMTQLTSAAIFFHGELWALLDFGTYEELVLSIGFIAIVWGILAYTIDCTYVCATTPASRDEGFDIVAILERWTRMAHVSTSSRNDDQPAASTETTPLRKLRAEANTGNFQTRLSRMVQNLIYHRQRPAQIDSDSEKGPHLEGPEVV